MRLLAVDLENLKGYWVDEAGNFEPIGVSLLTSTLIGIVEAVTQIDEAVTQRDLDELGEEVKKSNESKPAWSGISVR